MGRRFVTVVVVIAGLSGCGCGDDEGGGGGPDLDVGASCEVAEDCFADLEGEVPGEIICIDRVEEGYCSHACVDDTECCSIEGECDFGEELGELAEVCAPFESMGGTWCFVSCEDLVEVDGETLCQDVSVDLHCRSTGGGGDNRRVCLPDG